MKKHFILTRSAYPKHFPVEVNKLRLELSINVLFHSLRFQSNRNFIFLLLVNKTDPLLDYRIKACRNTGLEFAICFNWRAGIEQFLDDNTTNVVTTRVDDDDAITYSFVDKLQNRFNKTHRDIWSFPTGCMLNLTTMGSSIMRRDNNQFITLDSKIKEGNYDIVMDFMHGECKDDNRTFGVVDRNISWLWTRHKNQKTAGPFRSGDIKTTSSIKRLFKIKWNDL